MFCSAFFYSICIDIAEILVCIWVIFWLWPFGSDTFVFRMKPDKGKLKRFWLKIQFVCYFFCLFYNPWSSRWKIIIENIKPYKMKWKIFNKKKITTVFIINCLNERAIDVWVMKKPQIVEWSSWAKCIQTFHTFLLQYE